MARIVLGVGTSHSPQLSTPPDQWGLRVEADRANKRLTFQGQAYDYESLLRRRAPGFAAEVGLDRWRTRHAQCRRAIGILARRLREAEPDQLVIVGNDQKELFQDDVLPSITIYWGRDIPNIPATPEERATMGPGIAVAEEGHCPPEGATYPGAPELGQHIVRSLIRGGFDVAQSSRLPRDGNPHHGIPHAYGFVYRQLMADAPPPSVPVILNANVPPNPPTVARCVALGRAVRDAVESWPGDAKVAVIASGGLTHFVIDETLDRTVLAAFARGDEDSLAGIPEDRFQAGTGEIKSWATVASAMTAAGKTYRQVDYVPCYRSDAGTGTAMAFAFWE